MKTLQILQYDSIFECINDTTGRVIAGTEIKINDLGVYEARVEVLTIQKSGNGGYSSFFPLAKKIR